MLQAMAGLRGDCEYRPRLANRRHFGIFAAIHFGHPLYTLCTHSESMKIDRKMFNTQFTLINFKQSRAKTVRSVLGRVGEELQGAVSCFDEMHSNAEQTTEIRDCGHVEEFDDLRSLMSPGMSPGSGAMSPDVLFVWRPSPTATLRIRIRPDPPDPPPPVRSSSRSLTLTQWPLPALHRRTLSSLM